MAVTDKERREVARRLRSVDMDDFSCYSAEFEGLYKAIGLYDGEEYAEQDWQERLADLIEPSCCGKCNDCDRDALLALADEMESKAGAWDVTQGDIPLVHAGYLTLYARRIREALGG